MVDDQEKKVIKRRCIYGAVLNQTKEGLELGEAEIVIKKGVPFCVNKDCSDVVSACGYKEKKKEQNQEGDSLCPGSLT